MDKVRWCEKSARKPTEQPIELRSQKGRYLHEYVDRVANHMKVWHSQQAYGFKLQLAI